MAEVRFEGLDKLAAALKEFSPTVQRKGLRQAVAAGSKIVRDEAKLKAPVYTGHISQGHPPPGTLKRAIAMARNRRESSPGCEVYHVYVRRDKVRSNGRFDAYYAHMVEFGTVKMTARPFMRPAFEATKRDCVDAVTESLTKTIEQIAKDISR